MARPNEQMTPDRLCDAAEAVMLAVAAETIEREPRLVYQAATGDSNPNTMDRIVGMVGLYNEPAGAFLPSVLF